MTNNDQDEIRMVLTEAPKKARKITGIQRSTELAGKRTRASVGQHLSVLAGYPKGISLLVLIGDPGHDEQQIAKTIEIFERRWRDIELVV